VAAGLGRLVDLTPFCLTGRDIPLVEGDQPVVAGRPVLFGVARRISGALGARSLGCMCHRDADGFGYEVTGADVWAAYSDTIAAAERKGNVLAVRERIRQIISIENATGVGVSSDSS
jgi:hypothetical protein